MSPKPSPDDFVRAMRAAMADPDFHTQEPEAAQFLDRLLGHTPSATSCTPGRPLSTARLTIPVHHDFCARCGLDLFSHGDDVVITCLLPDGVDVVCDCGLRTVLPRWLFV